MEERSFQIRAAWQWPVSCTMNVVVLLGPIDLWAAISHEVVSHVDVLVGRFLWIDFDDLQRFPPHASSRQNPTLRIQYLTGARET